MSPDHAARALAVTAIEAVEPVEPNGSLTAPPAWLDAALDVAILRCDHAGRVVATFGPPELLPTAWGRLENRAIAELDELPTTVRDAWSTAVERCVDTQRAQIAAYVLDRGDGPRSFEARMIPVDGAVVATVRDVGERDRLRRHVEELATFDPLTGLVNMRALRERLALWLPAGADPRAARPVALLVIDLDRFKQTGDRHGRAIADTLLRLVAQRLAREAAAEVGGRPYDAHDARFADAIADDGTSAARLVVARLGGDQFAVAWRMDVRQGDDGGGQARAFASRLIKALGAPTRIAGQTLFVRASIGASIHPHDAQDASLLLAQADGALARAKAAGRNQYRRHGDDETAVAAWRPPATEAALRTALAADQFLVIYQPKFELASSLARAEATGAERRAGAPGAMIAVEALVRWRTPGGALLVPQDFIPLAETSGMIGALGDWVLRTALVETAPLSASHGTRIGLSVNVSLLQLHDRAFVETVRAALRDAGRAPDELTLEIAETAFVDDVRLVADTVAELSALGIRLAIDHFGTGTAGLVALKTLPVDEIKIDRSFIAGAAIDAFDATIVRGLVEMAHNLGKTVTAEGVERADQIAMLNQLRCDAIQGYFVGQPRPASEWIAASSGRSAPSGTAA